MLVLETKRLILRGLTPDDDAAMFEYASIPEVGNRAGWMPHRSMTETRAIINEMINDPSLCIWTIVLKETGKMIGTIALALKTVAINTRSRSLGYVLHPQFWGQGYMSEAVTEVLHYAFMVLNVDVMRVSHFVTNHASRRIIEKHGFKYEGINRHVFFHDGIIEDSCHYSLLKSEYFNFKAAQNKEE